MAAKTADNPAAQETTRPETVAPASAVGPAFPYREQILSRVFESSPDAITLSDVDTGQLLEVNGGFERLFGYDRRDIVGRTAAEVGIWAVPDERLVLVDRLAREGFVRDYRMHGRRADGTVRLVEGSAEYLRIGGRDYLVIVARDVAIRSATEDASRLRQRVDALSTLAGGIAHDFNNILTAMLAFAELVEVNADDPVQVREDIGEVLRAGRRAGALVRQILTYSQPVRGARVPTKLPSIAREALGFLRPTLAANIVIEDRIDPLAPAVLADPTQLHQVVMNLYTNAAHAMADRGGTLRVELGAAELPAHVAREERDLGPGPFVRLRVADSGVGMTEEVVARLYEPFFTTRPAGKGTGLGLPVAHSIVHAHGGAIDVVTRLGEGSSFDIYLPTVPRRADSEPARPKVSWPSDGHHVLFVDDEAPICAMAQKLLGRLGYRVTTCDDPTAALARFSEEPGAFHVVVTDLSMPRLSGIELARGVLQQRADVPIILVTGYRADWTNERVQAIGIREIIDKPFSLDQIGAALSRALAAVPA